MKVLALLALVSAGTPCAAQSKKYVTLKCQTAKFAHRSDMYTNADCTNIAFSERETALSSLDPPPTRRHRVLGARVRSVWYCMYDETLLVVTTQIKSSLRSNTKRSPRMT